MFLHNICFLLDRDINNQTKAWFFKQLDKRRRVSIRLYFFDLDDPFFYLKAGAARPVTFQFDTVLEVGSLY